MTRVSALLRLALAGACAVALAGCVSLFPKTKPAHLYRFGQPTSAEAPGPAPAGQVGVLRSGGSFQRESSGDQILTITGGRAAYIGETRWVAPAAVLWNEAVLAAFDADPGPVRLISRGEMISGGHVLRVDVRNFEAHYDRGPKAAPTVLVRVRATMTSTSRKDAVSEQMFEARVRAGGNRVAAIVQAYDEAVAQVLEELVAWTHDHARPAG